MAIIKQGSFVIMKHETKKEYIVGLVSEDFDDAIGKSSYLKLSSVWGLPVESAVVNTNIWKLIETRSGEDKDPLVYALIELVQKQ